MTHNRVVKPHLLSRLQSHIQTLLQMISAVAAELAFPLYLVGGPVRDLLLQQPLVDFDFDFAVEGDAIGLARTLQARFGGGLEVHTQFGTAKWHLKTAVFPADLPLSSLPQEIDFATARTETYTHPAALPTTTFGSIEADLQRRDFTINALAVRVDGQQAGRLLDVHNGQQDLRQKIIRVLHAQSFIDDPTRMWRAARFEQRLGFRLDEQTAVWLGQALAYTKQVSGERLQYEVRCVLREELAVQILARLDVLGVLAEVHPDLSWWPETADFFAQVPSLRQQSIWQDAATKEGDLFFVYLALWLTALPLDVQTAVMVRFRLTKRDQADLTAVSHLLTQLAALRKTDAPSRVAKALRPFSMRTLFVARVQLAAGEWLTSRLERYIAEWRYVKTAVTGHDLNQLGLRPGAHYGVILDKLLAEKINGRLPTEADERARLLTLVSQLGHESN